MPYLYRPRRLRVEKKPPSSSSWAHLREFDDLTANIESSTDISLRDLRAPLRRVPRSERGVDWTERVVIAYCIKRQKSGRVRSLRRDIIEYWGSVDQPDKSTDFESRLRAAIQRSCEPGSRSFFIDFSKSDEAATARELTEIIEILQGQGLKVFLNSGTLLGAVREQSFLKHDDDIDLGLIMKATNHADVADELVAVFNTLKSELDSFYVKSSFVSPVVKIKLASDIVVDLFPVYFCEDQLYVWPHTFGELNKEDLFPLQNLTIDGHDMPAPAAPEKMLALNYGPNWRLPDPSFRFPWAQARKKFQTLLKAYWWAVRINAFKGFLLRQ